MAKTYYTYRICVANRDRVQVEKWDAQHQDKGQPNGAFRYQENLAEIAPLLQTASNNELNDSSLVRSLGEALFDVLFDDVLRQDFVNFYYQVVQQEKQLLRVELDIDEQGMPEIAALPWEFMCVPARANLGTIWMGTLPDLVFSRRRSQWIAAQPIQLEPNEKLRIALVISAPPNLPPVAYEPIQAALEKLAVEQANRVELLPIVSSANPKAIDTILSRKPHIFHFIGHGRMTNEAQQEVGEIALVDSGLDEVMWVDADYFSELFNRHRPGLTMLQACEGGMLSSSQVFVGVASKLVQQNMPVVVAMQYEVTNSTACCFALEFYQQLATEAPVDIAAQYGRRAIALSPTLYRKRDFATPVIFMRVRDGYLFKREEAAAKSQSNSHPTIQENTWNIQVVDQQRSKYNINLGANSTVHQYDSAIVQAIQEKSAEAQKSGSISLHPQPGDRLKRLEELQRESRKQCIKHFRITISNKEDAVSLADDLSIGIPPSNLQLSPGKVILLVGQLGIGKTLIAQRLFQQAIQKAIEDLDAPIPMYLELGKSKQVIPLQKALENAANGLGNPKTQGAVVILDGLDEVDSRLANEILIEADNLIDEWEKTTVIITSRPSRYTDEIKDEIKEKIEVPPLSDDQAYALIERLTKRQINAMICSNWTEGIRDAIHRPLFALILAGYLQSDSAKAPRSIGELLSWMVDDALEKAKAEYSNCDQLLKRLAILSIECGGSVVRSADVAITPDALRPLLDSRLVIEPSRGTLSFPLRILTEWFAAQSLADNPLKVKDFIDDPRQLENWRYPLTIATANFNHEVVSQLLIPIAEKYPAFAAEIVRDSSTRWGSNEISLPPPYQCGQQIQTAMQAWVKGIGTLAKLIAPIQQDGKLRAIGVRTYSARLEAAWHSGNEERDIVDLPLDWMSPNSQERSNWISGRRSIPGHESAWAWRWTLDELVSNLGRQLQYPILPVDNEPIICEAAWRAAIAIIRYRQNLRLTKLNYSRLDEVPLAEIEETLCKIEAQSKLNCFITLPDIGSRAKVQDYYLKQLRKEVDRIQSLGESALHKPWLNLNHILSKRPCEKYHFEQLRSQTEQVYKAALDAYQQIVNTWFKQLIPGMYIAAMLPVRLVGVISPRTSAEGPKNFRNYIIDFDLFMEALPENAQNEAEITIGNIDVVITEDHPLIKANNYRINLANQQLSLLRPKSAVWIKTIPERWGFSNEFFRLTPATILAYSWLREDLTKIFGFGGFPRQTDFG